MAESRERSGGGSADRPELVRAVCRGVDLRRAVLLPPDPADASYRLRQLSGDDAAAVRWLDERRVVYFADGGPTLVVLDTVTRTRTVVDVRLPGPSIDETFVISPDRKTIYYGAVRAESDIWIVERR